MSEHKNAARAPFRPANVATLALSVGGLGFLRPAPGTWGSLPPVLVSATLSWRGVDQAVLLLVAAAFLLLASLVCVVWGAYAEQRFGRKDAAEVVADETAGVSLPVAAATLAADEHALLALLAAFVLFRLFDIAKPWPMNRLERLPQGWGVLADDLMAGVYAAFLVIVLVLWL